MTEHTPSLADAMELMRVLDLLKHARSCVTIARAIQKAPVEDRPAVARFLLQDSSMDGATWEQIVDRAPIIAKATRLAHVVNGKLMILTFAAKEGTYRNANATPFAVQETAKKLAEAYPDGR